MCVYMDELGTLYVLLRELKKWMHGAQMDEERG